MQPVSLERLKLCAEQGEQRRGEVGRVTSHAVADVCADKKAFKSYFDIINDS